MKYISLSDNSDDLFQFTGNGKVDGKDIEVRFKTLGRFISIDTEDTGEIKLTICPVPNKENEAYIEIVTK
ncbi:hypothetical protein [Siminovitchia fordii]|uniref:Uncharacterized protein n=1 Tax=Siminovitchia fordii TaxID=254759 RepID=A0ABQ4KBI6_9BACI|nr:hypothetical protein [Siminovitchia fordii]GIN22530.1 hypothetical protein J1TS3_36640 [Siminovitchia fordii]